MTDEVREFMSRVVPWPVGDGPGWVNIHWLRPMLTDSEKTAWSGKATRTLDGFLDDVRWGSQSGTVRDIYFCLSLQRLIGQNKKGRPKPLRLQANAVSLSAIWLDVDVKDPPKGYATLPEAINEVSDFVTKVGLPAPSALVASGGGVHVYWISDRALTPDEWKPYAHGLKAAAIEHGLRCDAGVTVDSARVLRVPGTKNFKTTPAKPVRLLGMRPKPDYDFATDLAMLPSMAPATARQPEQLAPFDLSAFPKGGAPTEFLDEPLESLADGLQKRKLPPLDLFEIAKECEFFRTALTTGGKDYSQPMWNLTTLAATWMEDGNALAHKMGNQHPGYSHDGTEALWDRKVAERADRDIGWPSCASIQAAGCAACAACPHFAKGKSPLNLATVKTPVTVAVTAALAAANPNDLELPDGFVVDTDGHICKVVEITSKDSAPVTEHLKLFTCTLSRPWVQKGPDALNFTTTVDMGNTRPVSMLMTKLNGSLEMFNELLRQGVKVLPRNKRFVEDFLMAWLTKLHQARAAMTSMPFGWYVEDGRRRGFVYGGLIMKDDGSERQSGHTDGELRDLYRPTGDTQKWFDAFDAAIGSQHSPALEAVVASSFAAPLMISTGEYTGLLSAWGDSGAGKSTAVKIAQAVWAHPKKVKEVVMSTSKSVVQKLVTLRHLPLYWDEIKDADVQKKVFDTVFGTEGVSPSRLHSNIQQQSRGDWQTLLSIGSNISFVDYVQSVQKTTDAGMNRVFEFHMQEITKSPFTEREISRLVQELEENFGGVGLRYAKYLGTQHAAIDVFVNNTVEEFAKSVGARAPERIWVAIAGTVIAGAALANQVGCKFDVPALRAFMVQSFFDQRERVKDANVKGGSVHNTEEILTNFLNLYRAHTVYTNTASLGRGTPKLVSVLSGPKPDQPKPVYIQWCVDDRLLRISKSEFTAYLNRQHVSPQQIIGGMTKHFKSSTVFQRLCSGTPYRCGQENVLHVPIPKDSSLAPLLNAHGTGGDGEDVTTEPAMPPESPSDMLLAATQVAAAEAERVRRALT